MDEPPIEIYLPPRHTNPYHRAREVRRDLLEKSNTVHYTKVLHHSAMVAPAGHRANLAAVHDSGGAAPKQCSDDVATPGQRTTVVPVDRGTHSMNSTENILFQVYFEFCYDSCFLTFIPFVQFQIILHHRKLCTFTIKMHLFSHDISP